MASARLCESEHESCVRRAKNKQRMASARACESEQEVVTNDFPTQYCFFFQYENM